MDQFFVCQDINPYPENLSPRLYYKGYSILLLRMLVINFDSVLTNWKERNLIQILQNILQKIGFADYDLKLEALMLVKCIMLPHLVKSKVYLKIAQKLKKMTYVGKPDFQLKLFFSLDP